MPVRNRRRNPRRRRNATRRRGAAPPRRATRRRHATSRHAATRQSDELVASLAHALRTRLHAMLGWLQLLRNGTLDAEKAEHALEVVHRNADAQVRLLEEAVDASRIVGGRMRIVREPVNPAAVLDAAIDSVNLEARRKHVALVKEIPPTLPAVAANPRRLRQILVNVLGNAVKFTPAGGHVRLSAAATRRGVSIEVRDDGIGIGKEALRHVFDGLRPAGGGTVPEHGGLGLGLAITRHLVRAHRGSIRIASEGPGHGTVVTLSLPVAAAGAAPAVLVDRGGDASLPILKDVTALVVDDHEDSSELLAAHLERRGAQVLRAADAGAAFETLARSHPDLLIADIAMPGMDGQELIRRVRDGGSSIPAIAVSAGAHLGDRDRALQAGFDAYCAKPVDAHEILRVIASLSAGR